MTTLIQRYQHVLDCIQLAEQAAHRLKNSVKLLAVSKKRSVEEIRQLIQLGQRAFGESYVQEALTKIQMLSDESLEWHFIGPIQSNKTKSIAEHFSWVHSVDRLKIARRLNDQRPENLDPLNVCIEVNLNQEDSKSGVSSEPEIVKLAQEIQTFPHLKLRGLMAIPEVTKKFDEQQKIFKKLSDYFVTLTRKGLKLDTLSMGMSGDFEAAIFQGATIVRIGTAIFKKF